MELEKRLDLFLTERRMTTKVEMTKAERELKLAKAKDTGVELYPDFTKFLAVYLNSLKGKELNTYRIINREKAAELVRAVSSAHPNMQALLDKLHLDSEAFVTRFFTKMDMKNAIQDAVMMLLKGEQNITIRTAKESKEEPVEEAKNIDLCKCKVPGKGKFVSHGDEGYESICDKCNKPIYKAGKISKRSGVSEAKKSATGHLRETPEEAGYTVVKTKGKELYLKDKDTDKVELWAWNKGGVPGAAIVYKGNEYEFIRTVSEEKTVHKCEQCGKDMGNEWILGPVCGKCVRANHKKVTGRK